MTTTCIWCGQTDNTSLMEWAHDAEGYWWHKGCRQDYLERIAEQLSKRPNKERQDGNGSNKR